MWDTTTGQRVHTLRGHAEGWVNGVAYSPDGSRLASMGSDGAAKIWDAATGQDLRTLKKVEGGVYCLTFSPDGTRLATGSPDHTIKIWDITTGQEALTLAGHGGATPGLAYALDGTRLVVHHYSSDG